MQSFKKIIFKNGLRLILIPQRASMAATMLILVEAGSEYEKKHINGISHFLEHLTFKGTTKRPQPGMIAEELASLGAESNAFTGEEYTGYWAKVESHKLPQIVDIVSDLYLNPTFNPDEIEKERGVIIEEINMYEDTPMRRVHDLFTTLLYGDQPAGWDVAGKKEIIRKLKKADFLSYRNKHYIPPATTVIVAGNFDTKQVIRQVRGVFGNLKRKPKVTKLKTREGQSKPRILVSFKKSDQSHLVLGVRTFNIFDKRRYALQILADILGGGMSSRLFRRIREELGAAYYVRATPEFFLDHGYLAASAGVDHQKTHTVLRVILEEFRRLRDDLIPEKELQRSKDHLVGSLILNLETSDELASFYGSQEILTRSLLQPKDLIDRIRNVKAEEIRDVARRIFRNSQLNLAAIGPYKGSKQIQKILKL